MVKQKKIEGPHPSDCRCGKCQAKRRIILYAPSDDDKADFRQAAMDSGLKGNESAFGWWLFKQYRLNPALFHKVEEKKAA